LYALGQGLEADFTPEVEAAWIEAYNLLSSVMIEAATAVNVSLAAA
jgi:hemoglobin-like flavoprotein